MEAKKSDIYFATLTYNNDTIPYVETSTGRNIRYADIADVQNMFKRIRKKLEYPIRYAVVSELGSKKGRPHFHILILVPKEIQPTHNDKLNTEQQLFKLVLKEWRRNYGSKKHPIYKKLCDYVCKMIRGKLCRTYDLHYVDPNLTTEGESNVAFYIMKYMLKPSNREIRLQQALRLNLPEDEYEEIWQKVRNKITYSRYFGRPNDEDVVKYLRKCIKLSYNDKFAKYYNPNTGASFPLARYYKGKGNIYTAKDAWKFYENNHLNTEAIDSPNLGDERNGYEIDMVIEKTLKRNSLADQHTFDDIFDELQEN